MLIKFSHFNLTMKQKLGILFFFISHCICAQNNFDITIPDNQILTLTNGLYGNIQLGRNSKLFIYGDVIVSSINSVRSSSYNLTVSGLGNLKVLDTFFLDGGDTLFNAGKIQAKSIVLQNDYNQLRNIGIIDLSDNLQVDKVFNSIVNEGNILVRKWVTFNNVQPGAYEATNCSNLDATYIGIFANNPIKGNGNVSFSQIFFDDNKTFTQSPNIYIIYFPMNPDKKWGTAKLNSGFCMGRSFPVEFLKTSFLREEDHIKYDLEVDKFSNIYNFSIEKSNDGKNWEEVLVPVESDRLSKSYTGNIQ